MPKASSLDASSDEEDPFAPSPNVQPDLLHLDLMKLTEDFRKFQSTIPVSRSEVANKYMPPLIDFFNRCASIAQKAVENNNILRSEARTESRLSYALNNLQSSIDSLPAKLLSASPLPQTPPKTAPSFADITSGRRPAQHKPKDFALVVEPCAHSHQSSVQTKADIQSAFDIVTSGLAVQQLKKSKDGRCVVSTASASDRDRLRSKLEASSLFAANYTVSEPKKRNPTMRLLFVPNSLTDKDISDTILAQNCEISAAFSDRQSFDQKINYVLHNKAGSDTQHIVIRVTPKLRSVLKSMRAVRLGWHTIRVEDFVLITRCFKCNGFGHRTTGKRPDGSTVQCPNKTACSHCAEEHSYKDCPKRNNPAVRKCVNCVADNLRSGGNIRTDHSALSNTCPHHQRQIQSILSRTDYD